MSINIQNTQSHIIQKVAGSASTGLRCYLNEPCSLIQSLSSYLHEFRTTTIVGTEKWPLPISSPLTFSILTYMSQISTEVRKLQWIFRQPTVIHPYFSFLGTLPMAHQVLSNIRMYLEKLLYQFVRR